MLDRFRVAVVKGKVPTDTFEGGWQAYNLKRSLDLPKRVGTKALGRFGVTSGRVYERLKPGHVQSNPRHLAWWMRSAKPMVAPVLELSDELAEADVVARYKRYRELNVFSLFTDISGQAFTEHQDSRGTPGLGFAVQTTYTLWMIHRWQPQPPAPLDFVFKTGPGDIVVVEGRQGECPEYIPPAEGNKVFYEDASPIHSGIVLGQGPRLGASLFHEELPEGVRLADHQKKQ